MRRRRTGDGAKKSKSSPICSPSFVQQSHPSKKLFPVFIDPPSTSSSLPPSLLEACASLSLASASSRPHLLHAKENVVAAVPSGGRLALGEKKKASFKALGVCSEAEQPKKRRIALRDVSQEYDVDGEEPEGWREVVSPSRPSILPFLLPELIPFFGSVTSAFCFSSPSPSSSQNLLLKSSSSSWMNPSLPRNPNLNLPPPLTTPSPPPPPLAKPSPSTPLHLPSPLPSHPSPPPAPPPPSEREEEDSEEAGEDSEAEPTTVLGGKATARNHQRTHSHDSFTNPNDTLSSSRYTTLKRNDIQASSYGYTTRPQLSG